MNTLTNLMSHNMPIMGSNCLSNCSREIISYAKSLMRVHLLCCPLMLGVLGCPLMLVNTKRLSFNTEINLPIEKGVYAIGSSTPVTSTSKYYGVISELHQGKARIYVSCALM